MAGRGLAHGTRCDAPRTLATHDDGGAIIGIADGRSLGEGEEREGEEGEGGLGVHDDLMS